MSAQASQVLLNGPNVEERRTMNRAIAPTRSNSARNVGAPATPVRAAQNSERVYAVSENTMIPMKLSNSFGDQRAPTLWSRIKQFIGIGGGNLLQNYVVTTNGGSRVRKNKNSRLHQKQMASSRRSRRASRRASRRGGRRNNMNFVAENNNGNVAVGQVSTRRNKRRGGSRRGSRRSRRLSRRSRRASRRASRNLRRAARLLKNAVRMSRKARSLRRRAAKAKKSRKNRKNRKNARKSRRSRRNMRKSRRSRKNRRNNRKNNNLAVGGWF
jgi:hypothetical protein